MNFEQRRLITNAFITYYFFYFLVVWIFDSRKLNDCINKLQEKAMRIAYRDWKPIFCELLSKGNFLTIYYHKLQKLATDVFKVYFGVAPVIMNNISKIVHSSYNLRNKTKFRIKNIHTNRYGTERVFLPYQTKNIKPSAKGI